MEFDAFLSYHSADKPLVRDLRRRLMDFHLRVWLDEEDLRPGERWQDGLEAGIRGARAVLVCLGASGIGPWENEEMQVAIHLATRERRPVIPVLLPGAPAQPALSLFLANRHWVDLRAGIAPEGMARLVWGITGTRTDGDSGARHDAGPDPYADPRPDPRPDPRRPALEAALEQLGRQYEAALHQSVNSPDAVAAVQAARQAEAIESRMDALRGKLDALAGSGA